MPRVNSRIRLSKDPVNGWSCLFLSFRCNKTLARITEATRATATREMTVIKVFAVRAWLLVLPVAAWEMTLPPLPEPLDPLDPETYDPEEPLRDPEPEELSPLPPLEVEM